MAIELVRKVANATHGGEFDLLATQTLGTKRFSAIGIGVDPTAPLHIKGATGTMRALIEKTGDGTAGLVMGNNVDAGGTDKHWLIGVVASAAAQLHFRTCNDGAGTSPTTVFSILRTGNAFFNSGTNTQLVTIDSANAGAAASTLAIRNSSLSAFNDGVKFVMGAGVFKFRDLADSTMGLIDVTGGGTWSLGTTVVSPSFTYRVFTDLNSSTTIGFAARNLNAGANAGALLDLISDGGTGSIFRTSIADGERFIVRNETNGVNLAVGATSWAAVSDERNKDIIESISNAMTKVNSLRAVIGKYTSDGEEVRRAFLIAQDVQAVLPEAVEEGADEDGTLSLRYTEVIPLLVAAIKELKAEFDDYVTTHP